MTQRTTIDPTPKPLSARRWPPARVAEVLDALARRQREVPAWALAECDGRPTSGDALAPAERALLAARLPALAAAIGARAAVAIGGAVRPADVATVCALLPEDVAVVADGAPAGDPTLRVLLPAGLPRPRLFVCADNALGSFGTVGAVRVLRAVRAAMAPRDRLLLGLDVRTDRAAIEDDGYDATGATAARHLGVLALLNRELRADFDARRFAYRVTYDAELRRVDTHLVALTSMRVTMAAGGALALARGASIRTAVDCKYDRERVEAMLAGVGLQLDEWTADEGRRAAVAAASPAR